MSSENEAVTSNEPESGASSSVATAPTKKEKVHFRSRTIDEKLEIVQYAKTHSINETAMHFKIDRVNVRSYKKAEEKLRALKAQGKVPISVFWGQIRPILGCSGPINTNIGQANIFWKCWVGPN